MWSGPRNLSTAMMRSCGDRADTFVCDEPLYGYYLKRDRRRAPEARRGDRREGLRLAEQDDRAARPGRPAGGRSGTRSTCPITWPDRSATRISTASPTPS